MSAAGAHAASAPQGRCRGLLAQITEPVIRPPLRAQEAGYPEIGTRKLPMKMAASCADVGGASVRTTRPVGISEDLRWS
jgi:hypothetical protein